MNVNNPKKITDQVKYNPVKSEMFNESVKVCMLSKGVLEHNMIRLYRLICRNCRLSLQS